MLPPNLIASRLRTGSNRPLSVISHGKTQASMSMNLGATCFDGRPHLLMNSAYAIHRRANLLRHLQAQQPDPLVRLIPPLLFLLLVRLFGATSQIRELRELQVLAMKRVLEVSRLKRVEKVAKLAVPCPSRPTLVWWIEF